jgi:hypothetical protein
MKHKKVNPALGYTREEEAEIDSIEELSLGTVGMRFSANGSQRGTPASFFKTAYFLKTAYFCGFFSGK